ncbi:MAG: aspartate 1-decarboxylase [Planctomycetota bacterium]|jgi:aspartate 1-decarboxylase|nr:aspartate 1-decarboxylase [Planctomycetota bacterium]
MLVTLLKSKIHRAVVTGSSLNYAGSISLPPSWLRKAGILEFEKVLVADLDNGGRFETYAIAGREGEVTLNGATARLGQPGDRVIIMAWGAFEPAEAAGFRPRIVLVDENNRAGD